MKLTLVIVLGVVLLASDGAFGQRQPQRPGGRGGGPTRGQQQKPGRLPRPEPSKSGKCEMAEQMYIDCQGRSELPRCQPQCGVEPDEDCTTQCNDEGFLCICRPGFILIDDKCESIENCPEDKRPQMQRPRPRPRQSGECEMAEQMYIDCQGRNEIPRCQPQCGVEQDEDCTTQCNDEGFLCICRPGFILIDDKCESIEKCPADERPQRIAILPGMQKPRRPGRQGMPQPKPMQSGKCEMAEQMYIDCQGRNEIPRCQPQCGVERDEDCTTQCNDEGFLCICRPGFILIDDKCESIEKCPEDQRPKRRPGMPRPRPRQSGKCEMAEQMYIDCQGRSELPRCQPQCGVEPDEDCTTQCNDEGFLCICRPGFILIDDKCESIEKCPEGERPEKRPGMLSLRPKPMQSNRCEGKKEIFIRCKSLFRSLPCELECGKRMERGCRKQCVGDGYCRCAPGHMRKQGDCVPRNQCSGEQARTGGNVNGRPANNILRKGLLARRLSLGRFGR